LNKGFENFANICAYLNLMGQWYLCNIFQKYVKCNNFRKSEISSTGDDGNGNGNGHGNGNGNGGGGAAEQIPVRESVGRGAKRGKPEPMAIYR